MAKLTLLPALPGLMLVLFAAGCSRPEARFSPDGKSLVMSNNDAIVIQDVSRRGAPIEIDVPGAAGPEYSPDGTTIVVAEESSNGTYWGGKTSPPREPRARFITEFGGKLFAINGVEDPFAWRPDSSEVVGVRGNLAEVIHLKSRQIVRSYQLSIKPKRSVWLGPGRDMAFTSGKNWVILQHGLERTIKTKGDILSASFDEANRRLIWVELFDRMKKGKIPKSDLAAYSWNLTDPGSMELLPPTDTSLIIGAPGRAVYPTSAVLSSDGSRLAVSAIVDASEHHVMEEFAALGGFLGNGQTPHDKVRLGQLQKLFKFRSACYTLDLNIGLGSATRRFDRTTKELDISASWIRNTQKLAVVYEGKPYLNPSLP